MAAKTLPSQAYLAQCFSYDAEAGELIWLERPSGHFKTDRGQIVFNSKFAGKKAGTINASGYLAVAINTFKFFNHRVIWKMVTGADPSAYTDHRDKNRLNNRFDNLRECSHRENSHNSRLRSHNKSGMKGVYIRPGRRPSARITLNGKSIWIGTFASQELAREAYCRAAKELFGEFWSAG